MTGQTRLMACHLKLYGVFFRLGNLWMAFLTGDNFMQTLQGVRRFFTVGKTVQMPTRGRMTGLTLTHIVCNMDILMTASAFAGQTKIGKPFPRPLFPGLPVTFFTAYRGMFTGEWKLAQLMIEGFLFKANDAIGMAGMTFQAGFGKTAMIADRGLHTLADLLMALQAFFLTDAGGHAMTGSTPAYPLQVGMAWMEVPWGDDMLKDVLGHDLGLSGLGNG
jgi:hypothetical protein